MRALRQAEELGLYPAGQGPPRGFQQVAVLFSELYSRTSGKPGCTMSAVKEGIPLLPPSALHVPTNVPLKLAQCKRLGGIPGGDPGQPLLRHRGKKMGAATDTWVHILALFFTCYVKASLPPQSPPGRPCRPLS